MKRLFDTIFTINKWLGFIGGLLILIASILMTYEVFMRYFMGSPTPWTYDTTRYMLLLIAFFAAAFTLQEKAHINVDFLIDRVGKSLRKLLLMISDIAVLIVSCFFFWYSYLAFLRAVKGGWKTLGNFIIPSSWLYFVVLVGTFLLAVTSIILFIMHSKGQERVVDTEYI